VKIDSTTTVLITGGDSGIGFGIAQAFVSAGARIVIAGLERDAVVTAAELLGAPAMGVVLDVRDRAAWARVVDEIWATHGRIDVLVNNAGVGFLTTAIEASFEQWDWVMDINLTGVYNGIRTVVPRMLTENAPARVVSTASIGGMLGASGAVYAAAKFGVVGLMEALNAELWDTPIGVSILVPGIVRTNIAHGLRPPGEAPAVQPGGASLDAIYAQPMEQQEVGVRVLDAVQADDLYIFTHAEHRPLLASRFDAILRSVPTQEAPEARAAVERMVLAHPMYDSVRSVGHQ
jgi:NAD(P)-dependent dehydrogenase (short-subunit alcohol dehydrogenase family)